MKSQVIEFCRSKEGNISYNELSKRLKTPRTNLARWSNLECPVSVEFLNMIRKRFNLPSKTLWELVENDLEAMGINR